MPWKVRDVKQARIEFVVQAKLPAANVSGLCREHGISRTTGYRWLQRYQECGSVLGLEEHSRRPHHSPRRTSATVEQQVIALWHRYHWGAKKLAELLRQQGTHLPVITVHRILKRNGLVSQTLGPGAALERFEREQPNELWQVDFKGEYRWQPGQCCYPLSMLDDHSRYVVGLQGLGNIRGNGVWASFRQVFQRYGVPQAMLFDHGTPWWSTTNGYGLTWVAVRLIQQGIKLYYSGIRHPQTQGKVERFHRTLKHAIAWREPAQSMAQWNALLGQIRDEYNQVRPHEALAMATPASRYVPSARAYQAAPPAWVYPDQVILTQLNSQGMLTYGRRRYFVCEALANQTVGFECMDNLLLVQFRHMYVREINLDSGRSFPLVMPQQDENHV